MAQLMQESVQVFPEYGGIITNNSTIKKNKDFFDNIAKENAAKKQGKQFVALICQKLKGKSFLGNVVLNENFPILQSSLAGLNTSDTMCRLFLTHTSKLAKGDYFSKFDDRSFDETLSSGFSYACQDPKLFVKSENLLQERLEYITCISQLCVQIMKASEQDITINNVIHSQYVLDGQVLFDFIK